MFASNTYRQSTYCLHKCAENDSHSYVPSLQTDEEEEEATD